jgi:CRP/FNR family transcriptional regulator, cyclic AMP receptor protein
MARRGTVDPTAELLGKVDLFSDLSPKELGVLASLAKEHQHRDGATIVEQGDTSARFYLVKEGQVAVKVNGRVRSRLGPGDYFGELAVIDGAPRSASCIADGPVTTLSLASFSLRPVLRQHPDVTLKLLAKVVERLRRVERAQLTS